jgi:hypothetical protein
MQRSSECVVTISILHCGGWHSSLHIFVVLYCNALRYFLKARSQGYDCASDLEKKLEGNNLFLFRKIKSILFLHFPHFWLDSFIFLIVSHIA